ncbi:MAG: dihydroorotase [Gammaproteobacteria bacterium]|nr:dihydroorotase [Gammaproteobacteria bacterium]
MSVYRVIEQTDDQGRVVSRSIESAQPNEFDELAKQPNVTRTPGMIDLYARLCEPGLTRKGSIATETQAAFANGVTGLVCAPDTNPIIDTTSTVELIRQSTKSAGPVQVLPMGALTRALEGQQLSEMATLSTAGVVAFSQADTPLDNTGVLLSAMEYAATFDFTLSLTPRDGMIAPNGCAHDGATASRLGLPGIPVVAETAALTRLLELAKSTGARLHLSRLSSARAVGLVRAAKTSGLQVTADVAIHHLYFSDEQIEGFDTNFHSIVPFRSALDRQALREGVADGTIDSICSDHSPQDLDSKLAPFPNSAPGLNALDMFLPLLLGLQKVTGLSEQQLFKCASTNPATIVQQDIACFGEVLVDTNSSLCLRESALLSNGMNTPLIDQRSLFGITGEDIELVGKVLAIKLPPHS